MAGSIYDKLHANYKNHEINFKIYSTVDKSDFYIK